MTESLQPINRDLLRAWVPARYLARGWRGPDGRPHPELTGWWATAAAEQLLAGQVAVQELEATFEALLQMLPYYEDRVDDGGAAEAGFESLHLAANLLGQPNNPALVAWLEPCLLAVSSWDDAKMLMAHLRAVLLQYLAVAPNAPDSGR